MGSELGGLPEAARVLLCEGAGFDASPNPCVQFLYTPSDTACHTLTLATGCHAIIRFATRPHVRALLPSRAGERMSGQRVAPLVLVCAVSLIFTKLVRITSDGAPGPTVFLLQLVLFGCFSAVFASCRNRVKRPLFFADTQTFHSSLSFFLANQLGFDNLASQC